MTTLFTTAGQYFAAIGGLHPLAETVNALAPASMWLKCTFHLKFFFLSLNFNQDSGSPYPLPVKGTAKLGKKKEKIVEKSSYCP
jgi:hypothetical protein